MAEQEVGFPIIGSAPVSNLGALPFRFKLRNSNYKIWSKIMEVHAAAVEETDPGFSKWHTDDAIVQGWLLKTMEPHLIGLFINLPTTHNIWENITQMFYDGADESQYYELSVGEFFVFVDGKSDGLLAMRFSDSKALSAGTGANGLEVDLSGIIDLVACHSVELVNDESETYERTAGMSFLAMGRTNTMDPLTEDIISSAAIKSVNRFPSLQGGCWVEFGYTDNTAVYHTKAALIFDFKYEILDLYLYWIRLGFGWNRSNPAFAGQFCSDDEPVAHSLESDKPETGSTESIGGGGGGEDEEEEPVDEPDDPMEEDAVNSAAVFCIRLKQPRSNLQHKMSVPELCRNFSIYRDGKERKVVDFEMWREKD
ncbi:hypothetical protein DVH24_029811 [Malus domestica]|uniref:Retrotransposon Copia-like N-terminal domain-containing protein n=1 Tax=Malus domestica TaxID=3750 RepID=A0A498HWB6_MALDO|nr:hypothetical protein DVH24_029811 [Malus domestica]